MEKSLHRFVDEAIKLELNMAKLYGIFSEYIDIDRSFWNRLEAEEKNHAALLKTAKEFIDLNRLPSNLVTDDIDSLIEGNEMIEDAIDKFILNPDRESTFKFALDLEKSAGELEFQRFMETDSEDKLTQTFQRLNRFDKDHSERILQYWNNITSSDK
jgi:hypothetical protein